MKKAIMNTMIILFALAMCVGCGQSSEQTEESVQTDVTKAEKQEQVQVEAEDEGRYSPPTSLSNKTTRSSNSSIASPFSRSYLAKA